MIDPVLAEALHEVLDPESGVNLVDMGLIYDAQRTPDGNVRVTMTLTTPACPASGAILDGVKRRLARVPGVRQVEVELVFEPRWTPAKITPAGREALGRR